MADKASEVAVIMRTRDRGLLLRRALADVCRQTYPCWQLLVINDGGDPEDVDRLVAAQPGLGRRVTVVHNAEPKGRAVAWNQGVAAAADADYIAVHDDDDTWHPTFLQDTVRHLDTTRDAAVAVRTEIVRERIEGDRVMEQEREIWEPSVRSVTLFDLLRSNRFVPIQMLYRRSVYEELGGVRADLPVVEDWEFNLRLAANRPVGFLDGEPLAFWHQRWDAEGSLANSVAAVHDEHLEADLRLRDEALRAYVQEHGLGGVLYLTKYLQREFELMHQRVTQGAGGLREVVELLRAAQERAVAQQETFAALEATVRQQAEQLTRQSERAARLEAAISDASVVSLIRRRYRRLKDRLTR